MHEKDQQRHRDPDAADVRMHADRHADEPAHRLADQQAGREQRHTVNHHVFLSSDHGSDDGISTPTRRLLNRPALNGISQALKKRRDCALLRPTRYN
ncbi:MAG: hypothetical protein WBL23_09615 [Salinisphaera sp.]|uniref:hypothetical protein n=1 Tax=Salinisphaera sp. TaxID=1914330 RepID=UPI003C7D90CE